MKTKPLSELEKAVEAYVTQGCGVSFDVFFTGEQTRDDWQCDGWKFNLKKGQRVESFEYFTGTGHRVLPTVNGRPMRPMSWDNVQSPRELARWKEKNVKPVIPPLAGLLYSLVMDGSAARQTFAEWCADLGYDTDSRKALATYEACQVGADKLSRIFTHAQIAHIAEMLQDY